MKKIDLNDICKSGFSTPWDAPLSPPFPFTFRNVEIFTAFYRTSKKAVEFLLPPPLESTSDIVGIHIYRMNDTEWTGPYFETNVMVSAKLPGMPEGGYSPYLFLNSDPGVAQGREVHGQPKKYAYPNLEVRGDLIVGTVERNGIRIITNTLAYKQNQADPSELKQYFDFTRNYNLKAIDHIDARPAIRQITSRNLANLTIHECWKGTCSVHLEPNVQAPIFRLPVLEPLTGFYWRAEFTLVPGEIVHDYLS